MDIDNSIVENILKMAHDIIEHCTVENDHIEYRKSITYKDGILKTACAYANNYMNREIGMLFIGIEEVDDKAMIESVENELKSLLAHIHPRPVYHLMQDQIDGRFYVILAVEPGNDGPYTTDQKAETDKKINLKAGRYIRVRRDTRLPNKREEYELLKKFAEVHFTSELNERATLDDLSYEYMREYLVRTNEAKEMRELSKLDMARALHLIDDSEYGGYRAKNFAVLMFADHPDEFIPYAYVQVIREVIGTDKMESKIFKGPIWIQAQRVRDYFKDYVMASYTVREPGKSGAHKVFNWPLEMFEELSTNCILHKEYSRPQYIGIYVYHDHLSFVNHNRPLPPVTIEDLNENTVFDDRQYLNVELKEMFYKLDLIQSYGSGIRRAKMAMKNNGSPNLLFNPDNDIDDYTQAIAYINEEFARIREEGELRYDSPQPNDEVINKDDNQEIIQNNNPEITESLELIEERIIAMLVENPRMTREELAEKLGISFESVKYRLKKLKKSGKIERQGSRKNGEWVVSK